MEQVKQTAVEWLKGVIESCGKPHELQMSWSTLDEIIEQAKEMEKQQIKDAVDGFPLNNRNLEGEQYYEQTYGGNK
jgi:hypothetical protein